MFATELYALPILRPLAAAARERGHDVGWVVTGRVAAQLEPGERRLTSASQMRTSGAQAVYCAANWVSPLLPGTKVQVFHGFNAEKREPDRGHFALRGFFDLYLTQGPATTAPFEELAREHGYFAVRETGWPKLDPLFRPADPATDLHPRDGRPVVMFASTFSRRLSCAPFVLDTLRELIARGDRYWLLTLHPMSPPELIEAYRGLAGPHSRFEESSRLMDMQRAADVLLCDTSSVLHEFAVQLKPVVTVRNRLPRPFMLDVRDPADIDAAITTALSRPEALMRAITEHADAIHPWRDGRSSERMLDAVDAFGRGELGTLKRKPLNLVRRYKAWRETRELISDVVSTPAG
jgi:CDP-glycerol:poly(glycerophosphate) glycerophosphotransferase